MITLRPCERRDFPQLIAWSPTPEFLLQWAGPRFVHPLTDDQLDAYLRLAESDPPEAFIFSVEDASERLIGHLALTRIDWENRSARLSSVLIGDPSLRGKGIGGEMVSRVLRIGFEEHGFEWITLGVFDFNEPAIRLYERLGFRKDGELREYRDNGGQLWTWWEMRLHSSR